MLCTSKVYINFSQAFTDEQIVPDGALIDWSAEMAGRRVNSVTVYVLG